MDSEKQFKLIFIVLIISVFIVIIFYETITVMYKHNIDSFYNKQAEHIINNIDSISNFELNIHSVKLIYIKDINTINNIDTLYIASDFKEDRSYAQYLYNLDDNKIIVIVFNDFFGLFGVYFLMITIMIIPILIGILLFHVSTYLRKRRFINKIQKIMDYEELHSIDDIPKDSELQSIIKLFDGIILRCKEEKRQLMEENEKLKSINDKLKNKDNLKTGIIENVSHEFLTPLTKIKGYLEYIYNGELGELNQSQKEGLFIAKKNVDLLMKHINNILEYVKMEGSKTDKRLISIKKILMEIYKQNIEEAKSKNIKLQIDVNELKTPIIAYRESIYELFGNLVNNALKFTPKNGIIKIIGFERKIDDYNYAVIKIKDTGIGIEKDKIDKVFNRFYQIDNKESRRYSGMGLGLTIVKSILDEYNGKVEVKSVYGKGSEFIVRIPLNDKREANIG